MRQLTVHRNTAMMLGNPMGLGDNVGGPRLGKYFILAKNLTKSRKHDTS